MARGIKVLAVFGLNWILTVVFLFWFDVWSSPAGSQSRLLIKYQLQHIKLPFILRSIWSSMY